MFAKKTLLLAMFATAALPLQADPLTVYGKINVSAQSSDEGAGSFSELKSNASRFGVKGDYALDGELSLIYQLEWEVDVTDEANEKNIKGRDQFIGLKGSFGTIKAGRNDTALKLSQGKIDLFGDYEADIKTLWKGENRMSNSLAYISPSFQGFSLLVSHIMEDSPEGKDGQSIALLYGDDSLKESALFASIALDNEVNGYDAVRFISQVKVAGLKVGAGLQQQEAVATGKKEDGWLANVAYPIDKYELKFQYQTLEDHKGYSLGTDYKIGKDTKLFAWYSSFDFYNKADSDYLAIGIEHKF
ncbi:MAG: porin [Gammaproteobacteria bacterium]|jgi:predicted porin|nr:porin [Gammaproteobacteria bacterium]MBU2178435.1 porin [Gammaproteobacteria bacterium]MBU2223827.1 porin [Gammaproteobacteria bacterium]MBU2279521.1 porin [Gammaproteobacteria bacterium]MBU2426821.1 porin [Gammaproteobacteria bacterium]